MMNSDLQYFFSSKWIQATAECPIEQQGGAPLFLRSFTVKEKVQRAVLYITALGIFECFLNAKRTDDTLFNPGWTDYAKRVQYCTFDVTDQIVQGKNDFAVLLGAGWYAGHSGMSKPAFYGSAVPKCKFCLCLHYDSGRDEYIQSDAETLVTRDGPITYNDHLMGETYDGTRPSYAELLQRQDTAFDKCIVNTNIHTKPTPFLGEPIRVLDTLQAVSVQFQTKNTAVIDFGQNSVGVVELRLRAKTRARLQIRHGEILYPDGRLYTENLRTAKATDVYIARGNGEETYRPTFTYHGFRYAEVSSDSPFELLEARSVVIANDLTRTGFMQTSDNVVNKLLENAFWGQRCNHFSIPTDCPQRDERLGWLGDVQIFARSGAYQMNTLHFLKKWLVDVRDGILPDGSIPDVCPDMYHFSYGTAAWADAIAIVPQTLYEMYGNTELLEENFDALQNWVDYCIYTSDGFLRPAEGYGDWLNIDDDTDKRLISTAYFHYSVLILLNWMRILGCPGKEFYTAISEKIKAAFKERYLRGDLLANDSQTAYILSLKMQMFDDPKLNEKLAARLVEKIRERNNHLSCGFLGVSYLCPILTEYGYHELAYTLLLNRDYPSWGYSVVNGATTIWERWNSWSNETGFGNAEMNSYNHYALGSIVEWLYAYAAGIQCDKDTPGFKNFIFCPYPDKRLPSLKADYLSAAGKISVAYTVTGETFDCTLTIPLGMTASLRLPNYLQKARVNGEAAPQFLQEGTYHICATIQ